MHACTHTPWKLSSPPPPAPPPPPPLLQARLLTTTHHIPLTTSQPPPNSRDAAEPQRRSLLFPPPRAGAPVENLFPVVVEDVSKEEQVLVFPRVWEVSRGAALAAGRPPALCLPPAPPQPLPPSSPSFLPQVLAFVLDAPRLPMMPLLSSATTSLLPPPPPLLQVAAFVRDVVAAHGPIDHAVSCFGAWWSGGERRGRGQGAACM